MGAEAQPRERTLPPVQHGLNALREDDLPLALRFPEPGKVTAKTFSLLGLSDQYLAVDVLWSNIPEVGGVTAVFHRGNSTTDTVLLVRPEDVVETTCPMLEVPRSVATRYERDVLGGRIVEFPGAPVLDRESVHEVFWTLTKALRSKPKVR